MTSKTGLPLNDAEILVSVVIPVYNGEAYLSETVESVLAQTHRKLEVIIVDDGSEDRSPAIMRKLALQDERIRLIFQPHGGISRAMNTGIQAAQGEFIAYLDQDDIALPGRLTTQLAYIRQADLDICGSWAQEFGAEEKVLSFPRTYGEIQIGLLFYCALLQPTVMLRADIAKANLYDEHAIFLDYEMWTRLATTYRMGNIPQILTEYRRHAQQTHVRFSEAFRGDMIKHREHYFYTLLPQAAAQDYMLLLKLVKKKKLVSIAELQQTSAWMAKLARLSGMAVSVPLGQRWLGVCRHSSYLGYGVLRVYYKYSQEFPPVPWQQRLILWVTCMLRMNVESDIYKLLARIKHKRTACWRKAAAEQECGMR